METTEPTGHGVAAEPAGVSTRTVVRFGVFLTVLSLAAMLLMAALFRLLERRAERQDAAAVAAAGLERRQERLPPQPRLQVKGTRHWEDFRTAEEKHLASYGWMDRSTGAVHIPIERAMELIAERGVGPLPAAPAAVPRPASTPGAEVRR